MALAASLAIALFATACGGGKSDSSSASTASAYDELTPAKAATSAESTPAKVATKNANPPKSNADTDVFRQIAVKSCMDSAAQEDVSAAAAEDYCTCAIDELLQNVDPSELTQIGEAAASGNDTLPPDVEDKLMTAVMDCLDKLTGQ
jgi:hypothetical protein